jgi:hypothetical protein
MLEHLGDDIMARNNPKLTSLHLPKLTATDSDVEIRDNDMLTHVSLPMLELVGNDIDIHDNAALTSIFFPLLTMIRDINLNVSSNSALAHINLPMLTLIGDDLIVVNNPALTYTLFSKLTHLGNDLFVQTNALVPRLSFPLLTRSGIMEITNNAVLTLINAPKLDVVLMRLVVSQNPLLTYLNVPLLDSIGDYIKICENGVGFLVPTGSPNAPSGGLDVTGTKSGTRACQMANGTGTCGTMVNCP